MNSNKFKSVRSKPQSFGGSVTSVGKMSGVILQRQKRIVNNGSSIITSKSSSKNLSNENKHCTGVFVVFKTKHELKCQFSGITEIL